MNQAPHINLTSNRVRRSELETKLASGDIDIAVDILLPVDDAVKHKRVKQDKLVVVGRKDHPLLQQAISLDDYLAQSHVLVSARTSGPSIEDFELGRLGLQRKIGLRCQHLFSACRVISTNDMLLTLPENAARMYSELLNLSIAPIPVELPSIDVHVYWHVNVDKDPANMWIREQMIEAAKSYYSNLPH